MEIFTEAQLQIIGEMKATISKLNELFKRANEEKLKSILNNGYDADSVSSVELHIGCRLTDRG